MQARTLRATLAGALVAALTAAGAAVLVTTQQGDPHGQVVAGRVDGTAAGAVDYNVYLPPGYDAATDRYPVVYLMHGRGDTSAAWPRVAADLDELIGAGDMQPIIAVMPDAPWNNRGSWYTDSLYTGTAAGGPGVAVETALSKDLVAHIDATYRTVADREARAVGGYSMGGSGALRFATAHQQDFSAAIVLSPAVYTPQPPADSSAREYGGYGVGASLFDAARYEELNYPTTFEGFDAGLPVHLFIAVGDDEWPNPDPAEAHNDIDFESAKLYNSARRVPGITAELRIMNGGHDWDVWQPGFREGIVDVASRLRTEPVAGWEAEAFGTSGDDRAGGVVEHADGSTTVVLNVAGDLSGHTPLGGMDVVVLRRDASGKTLWQTTLGTAANDRAYGVVEGEDGEVLIGGYTRGTWATGEERANDDMFMAVLDAEGKQVASAQVGDPGAADRAYGVASDGAGGIYLAGYTSGRVGDQPSAGDKDIVAARVSRTGQVLWVDQFGGAGEDKAMTAATGPDGSLVLGGIATDGLPDAPGKGSGDGWVAGYGPDGVRGWIAPVATEVNEQVSGVTVLSDGQVLAIGHTKGTLGEANLGDNDIFVASIAPNPRARAAALTPAWVTQLGTSTDDRGAAIVATPDGGAYALAATYGAMGTSQGGVDVVGFAISTDGDVSAVSQFGSRERDGSDEWDETNLSAAAGAKGVWATGLTFGAPTGFTNAGAGDVFLTRIATGPSASPSPTASSSASPSASPSASQPPTPSPSATAPASPSPSATTGPTSTASGSASPSTRPSPGLPSTGQGAPVAAR
ncbi:hypothetical protein BW730_15830 [Tessaracoccus aquimaris]|uniref:Esterase n=1 Tax=Tessaracoccus aquimaris TaxID=1332264 RepID=A0A1Q2CRK3_9ACTN|nr:alpha/beta hydrolase-fold protein [Tessaracoccus aquimaris]AQP48753.1 hypothetical protein BW730_15830 [Tessaracoccus aquimaris]